MYRRPTIHWSTHPQGEQDETEKPSYDMDRKKKAYDLVPHNWIIECLRMYKISSKFIKFIENTMEKWRVGRTAGEKSLAKEEIQSGSSREMRYHLFIIAMMPLIHIGNAQADENFINHWKKSTTLCTWEPPSCLPKMRKNWEPKYFQWEYTVRRLAWNLPKKMRHEIMKSGKLQITEEIVKVKLATIVEGDPRCRRGRNSILWIATHYPWSSP